MDYTIYHVLYDTGWSMNQEAKVATDSEERISDLVEEHVRSDTRVKASSRKAKDIGFRVLGFADTGFRTNKEGIIDTL